MIQSRADNAVMIMAAAVVAQITDFLFCTDETGKENIGQISCNNRDNYLYNEI